MRANEFRQGRKKVSISGTEVAASIAATVGQCLRKHGIEGAACDEIALDVLKEMRTVYGGQAIYFPKGNKEINAGRDEEIFERFNSNELSVPELAAEYNICIQWVYRIIAVGRANRKAEREAERETEKAMNHERWKREN